MNVISTECGCNLQQAHGVSGIYVGLYKSDRQTIKSEVSPKEFRGLNGGVDDMMAVNIAELTMIQCL